jgi:hypothetical protein
MTTILIQVSTILSMILTNLSIMIATPTGIAIATYITIALVLSIVMTVLSRVLPGFINFSFGMAMYIIGIVLIILVIPNLSPKMMMYFLGIGLAHSGIRVGKPDLNLQVINGKMITVSIGVVVLATIFLLPYLSVVISALMTYLLYTPGLILGNLSYQFVGAELTAKTQMILRGQSESRQLSNN